MASEQNYFETTKAQTWVNDVTELLEDTNSTLKNASQLLQDIGNENVGTLGKDLQDQGKQFIDAFTEMAHGFASCVSVVFKHIENVVKEVADNENLMNLARSVLNLKGIFAGK